MDPFTAELTQGLNNNQAAAVVFNPTTPLQILAGPGSGKTRVLTSRVAYLVNRHRIPPNAICCVTFTNKAANEMKHRLTKLLGPEVASKLVMGTFHSIGAKQLRIHGPKIGLPSNFTILDQEDSSKLITTILNSNSELMSTLNNAQEDRASSGGAKRSIKQIEKQIREDISRNKGKWFTPEDAMNIANTPNNSGYIDPEKVLYARVYAEYEQQCKSNNSLDFDSILIESLKLYQSCPWVLAGLRHALVDEFQDTNIVQYEMMKCFINPVSREDIEMFGDGGGGITIVGDPDQSIYGWRQAEIANIGNMQKAFPTCEQIFLEENYRSSSTILNAALQVVREDKERIDKGLYTGNDVGEPVTFRDFEQPEEEAQWIAQEIKRVKANTGLDWDSFAILLRMNSLSRAIEGELQREGIPNKMVGGFKFFDRAEIKDVLAYLQLVDNPSFEPAFSRVVNSPKRGLGDKAITAIIKAAKEKKIPAIAMAQKIVKGSAEVPVKISKAALGSFLKVFSQLREMAASGASVVDLIKKITELTDYHEYLQRTEEKHEEKWNNILELISYAVVVADQRAGDTVLPEVTDPTVGEVVVAVRTALVEDEEDDEIQIFGESRLSSGPESDIQITGESFPEPRQVASIFRTVKEKAKALAEMDAMDQTPLRLFLQASMLATDTESQKETEKNVARVTISTVHAAKGLEWPIVFLPALEDGIFPAFFTKNKERSVLEERRLLYVAMTRPQALLYCSQARLRMVAGRFEETMPTPFLEEVKKSPLLFSKSDPKFDKEARESIYRLLHKPPPDEETIAEAANRNAKFFRFIPNVDDNTALKRVFSRNPSGGTFSRADSSSGGVSGSGSSTVNGSRSAKFSFNKRSNESVTDEDFKLPPMSKNMSAPSSSKEPGPGRLAIAGDMQGFVPSNTFQSARGGPVNNKAFRRPTASGSLPPPSISRNLLPSTYIVSSTSSSSTPPSSASPLMYVEPTVAIENRFKLPSAIQKVLPKVAAPPPTTLNTFTNASSSSLNMFKTLGLPDAPTPPPAALPIDKTHSIKQHPISSSSFSKPASSVTLAAAAQPEVATALVGTGGRGRGIGQKRATTGGRAPAAHKKARK